MITREAVGDLLADYGWLLDNDKLEAWTGLFAEEARYDVIPRENFERDLPVCLISCCNRAMIADRVLALRKANQYNIHRDRHLIGTAKFIERSENIARIEASYLVVQTDQGGSGKLFSAGAYHMRLALAAGRILIVEQIVVVDTFCVPTLIATPI